MMGTHHEDDGSCTHALRARTATAPHTPRTPPLWQHHGKAVPRRATTALRPRARALLRSATALLRVLLQGQLRLYYGFCYKVCHGSAKSWSYFIVQTPQHFDGSSTLPARQEIRPPSGTPTAARAATRPSEIPDGGMRACSDTAQNFQPVFGVLLN
jgi:hypothetical protein